MRFYYPGLRVEQYVPAPILTLAPRPAPAPPLGPDRPADVLVALPAHEESDRALVVQVIRRARDEIAKSAGLTPPAAIRVTVHPSVESFGRATGQPWWVSGATDRTSIDLLPVTMLRQQGQLDRTIRHEVAHVLLDETLRQRPMWVREGAAYYFADPARDYDRPGRTACPTDDEFRVRCRPARTATRMRGPRRADGRSRRERVGER